VTSATAALSQQYKFYTLLNQLGRWWKCTIYNGSSQKLCLVG